MLKFTLIAAWRTEPHCLRRTVFTLECLSSHREPRGWEQALRGQPSKTITCRPCHQTPTGLLIDCQSFRVDSQCQTNLLSSYPFICIHRHQPGICEREINVTDSVVPPAIPLLRQDVTVTSCMPAGIVAARNLPVQQAALAAQPATSCLQTGHTSLTPPNVHILLCAGCGDRTYENKHKDIKQKQNVTSVSTGHFQQYTFSVPYPNL